METWYGQPGQADGVGWVGLQTPYQHSSPVGNLRGAETEVLHSRGYWQVYAAHPNWKVNAVTDYELGLISPKVLRQYAEVVFPGHTEYFTDEMYQQLTDYKAHGGNMVFWGANNIYARVNVDEFTGRMNLLERPSYRPNSRREDFPLLGNGYIYCCFADSQYHYQATTRAMTRYPWLFAHTGITPGVNFGSIGSEVDTSMGKFSDPLTRYAASARLDYLDPNTQQQMTPRVGMTLIPSNGGVVFSSGSLSFLTAIIGPDPVNATRVARLVANVQDHLLLPQPQVLHQKPFA